MGCTLGLVLFRATELELDVSIGYHLWSTQVWRWYWDKWCEENPKLSSELLFLPRAPLCCLQLMLLLESPFQWLLRHQAFCHCHVDNNPLLVSWGFSAFIASPQQHPGIRAGIELAQLFKGDECRKCVACFHYFKGEFCFPTLPSWHFIKEEIWLYSS